MYSRFELRKEHKAFGFFAGLLDVIKAIYTKNVHRIKGCYSTLVFLFVLSGQLLNLLTPVVMKMVTHWIGEFINDLY